MMIKVSGDYLDFDGDIQIERQVKTQDTISNAGDFSYSFDIPVTAKNLNLLGIQSINIADKGIYQKSDVSIEVNGIAYYHGFLQVSASNHRTLSATFFSGNSGWFSLINDKFIYELELSSYKQSSTNYNTYWSNSEWITFPLINNGLLTDWSTSYIDNSHFIPFVYAKSIFKVIFNSLSIKLDGDLFNDAIYNSLILGSNSISGYQVFANNRKVNANKTANQLLTTTQQDVTFTGNSFPYYFDKIGNFNGTRYVSDVHQRIKITVNLRLASTKVLQLYIVKNGINQGLFGYSYSSSTAEVTYKFINPTLNVDYIDLQAGDELKIGANVTVGTVNATSGYLLIEVVKPDDYYPQYILGTLKQGDLVKSVFEMFNVIASFNTVTSTLTCNLFKNLENNAEDDWTEYVKEFKFNYTDILSNFSKKNSFSYKDSKDQNITDYNLINPIHYGSGELDIDNDFISDKIQSYVSIPFLNSYNYLNKILNANLMGIAVNTYTVPSGSLVISSVADDGAGIALFTTSTNHNFNGSDYVYITNTSTGDYIGLGICSVSSATTFKIQNLAFVQNATGNCDKITISTSVSDDIYIGINIPNETVGNFAGTSTINYRGSSYSNIAYAYFVKTDVGRPIDSIKLNLAFDKPNLTGYNGTSLLDTYYALNKRILNDPVKCFATMILPYKEFVNLDFSKPKRIKINNVDMKCFVNRITGYKDGSTDCTVELIKI